MATRIRQFADIDQHWQSHGNPVAESTGRVLACGVPWSRDSPGFARSGWVAREPEQLTRLANLLDDSGVRRQLSAVSLEEHSVIVLRGVANIEDAGRVRIYDPPDPEGVTGEDSGSLVIAEAGHASEAVASVLVVDRLPSGVDAIDLQAGSYQSRIPSGEVETT